MGISVREYRKRQYLQFHLFICTFVSLLLMVTGDSKDVIRFSALLIANDQEVEKELSIRVQNWHSDLIVVCYKYDLTPNSCRALRDIVTSKLPENYTSFDDRLSVLLNVFTPEVEMGISVQNWRSALIVLCSDHALTPGSCRALRDTVTSKLPENKMHATSFDENIDTLGDFSVFDESEEMMKRNDTDHSLSVAIIGANGC